MLEHLAPLGWPIRLAVDDHVPYRLGFAANRAVNESAAKVLLIHYADVIVPHPQIREAVGAARARKGQAFAFDEYVHMGEPGGEETVEQDAPANACMAIQRRAFWEAGGYDEDFTGWGPEDREFNDRCQALWPAWRVHGRLEHLWHGKRREDGSTFDTSEEQVAANRAYYASLQDG